jgi:UDP-GlcNAc3NAcA epimerase
MENIVDAFSRIKSTIVLPLHPRTKKTLGDRLEKFAKNVIITEPVAYLDMLLLEQHASLILTDSGGVQKEAYWAGVPCVTLRDETEWVELVDAGVNQIVGADTKAILSAVDKVSQNNFSINSNKQLLYGNGNSAEKIVAYLVH